MSKGQAFLLPDEVANKCYLQESMSVRETLSLLQFLCDQVAQTDVLRESVDRTLEDAKELQAVRRQERIEYRKLYVVYYGKVVYYVCSRKAVTC